MRHEISAAPELYQQFLTGLRRHDIRVALQGTFTAGDEIRYREHEKGKHGIGLYTGRQAIGVVSFVSEGGLLPQGVCVLSVEVTEL